MLDEIVDCQNIATWHFVPANQSPPGDLLLFEIVSECRHGYFSVHLRVITLIFFKVFYTSFTIHVQRFEIVI